MTDTPRRLPLAQVLTLAFAQVISWGTLYYGYALFLAPMEAELGLSRTETSSAFSIGLVASALTAVPVGRRIDAIGGRRLMMAGSLIAAVLCVLWSRVTSLAGLYAVWVAMGATLSLVLYEPLFAIVRRTLKAEYGRTILVITFVGGLAGTFGFPVVHLLVEAFGWRTALLAVAGLHLFVAFPIHALLLPRDEPAPVPPPGADGAPAGDPLARALRLPVFWLLVAAFALSSFLFAAVSFHLIPVLIERGFSDATAVTVASLIGPCQVLGRFALLFTEGRIGNRAIGLVAFGVPAIGLIVLALASPGAALVFAFPLFYGIGLGLKTIAQATAAPEFIGPEGYGAIQGALGVAGSLARAAGPWGAALAASLFGGTPAMGVLLFAVTILSFLAYLAAVRFARV